MDNKLSIKNTKQQLLDAYVATKDIQEEKQILIITGPIGHYS